MRLSQFLSKKLSLTLLLMVSIIYAYPQDSVLLKLQASHKSSEYISFDVQPLFSTDITISRTTDREVMKQIITPGFAVGVDYQRVSQSGFMIVSGIHFRMIPVAYKFNSADNDFGEDQEFMQYSVKNNNLLNGHFYFPVQAGYTFNKKIRKWQPSFMAGVNLGKLIEYNFMSSYSYRDDSGVSHPIQNILINFPERKLWMTYTANIRASKTLRNGNQLFFGVNANFSGKTYNSGEYNYHPNSGKQSGTFRDTGSYLALQFGFSLVRRYQEPEKFGR